MRVGLGSMVGVGDGILVGVSLGTLVALGSNVGVLVGTDIAVEVAVRVGVAGEKNSLTKGRLKSINGRAIARQTITKKTRETTIRLRLRFARRWRTSEVRSREGVIGNKLGVGTGAAGVGEAGIRLAAQKPQNLALARTGRRQWGQIFGII